jgi:Xaa-Pro aminopeptidase
MSGDRLARLQAALEEPLLVSSLVNIRYLTGLASSNAALLVEPGGVRLFTDFRYAERARAIPAVELVMTRRDIYAELPELLAGRIGFEPKSLSYERYSLLAAGSGIELVPRQGVVEAMRAVKDDGELDAIRRAAHVTNEAYERFAAEPIIGRRERDLAWRMQALLHEFGGEKEAFDVIVAGGPTGGSPHAEPGDRTIGTGETVVVDAGCRVGGYCSDCTRTFVTGELPPELERAYDVVKQAQETGLAAVRAGADSKAVDRAARDVVEEAGLGDAFGHGLGHGVGLEVHEAPWLNAEWPSVLAPRNVVTVEPGVYLPGLGGVRIEDLVVVTEDCPEVLTSFTKEAVRVG